MSDSPSPIFRDRLTGDQVQIPPATGTLVGRWILADVGQQVFMNSAAAAQGEFLVPDSSGRWRVLIDDGQLHDGTVAREQMPDDLEVKSVRTIGDKLSDLIQKGASWLEWIDIVPLVPGISEQLELQSLELLVREYIGHLEVVCQKPRAHLHVEVERVPASKARRISPAAAAHLAAHTEDWEQRLISGILPKQILAEVQHDQINIYENRIAARLLDNLCVSLNHRILALRRLLNIFKEKEDFSESLAGTYQRSQRISELWGESIDANEGCKKAEAALQELEWLKYKLMGLQDSPLYKEVPRRAYVPTTIKNTNILTNDPHYRRVAELWREWAKTGAGQIRNATESHQEAQRLCRSMDMFTMLLAVRAFDTLGFEPSEATLELPLRPGCRQPLHGHGMDIIMNWREDGTFCIEFDEQKMMVVALSSDLGAGSNARIRDTLDQLKRGIKERERENMLVLFLESDDDRASADPKLFGSLHTVGNDPRNALTGDACLPISPWRIGSTERVARALRWFLFSARYCDYPLSVTVPQNARDLIKQENHTRWLGREDGGMTLKLIAPPENHEWKQLNLERLAHDAKDRLEAARSKHERLFEELKIAVRNHKTGSLARQKSDAHEGVIRCEQVEQATRELVEGLRDARDKSASLLQCPACGKIADSAHEFEPRGHGCFQCACSGCSTRWETRICSKGHKYPVMLPSGNFPDAENQPPGWEDRVYGCDILAVPARKPDGQWGFVCPHCAQIS